MKKFVVEVPSSKCLEICSFRLEAHFLDTLYLYIYLSIVFDKGSGYLQFQPFFSSLDVLEELLVVSCVLQVCFEAVSKLQKPSPLGVHGSHVCFDCFGGWVILKHQTLSTFQYYVELHLAFSKSLIKCWKIVYFYYLKARI